MRPKNFLHIHNIVTYIFFTLFLKIDSIFCHKCFCELEYHTKLTFGFFTGGSCGKSSTFTYYHFRSIFHLCNSKLKLLLNNDKYIHYNLADVFILFICIINFLIASQNISFTFESCFQQRDLTWYRGLTIEK